VPSSISQTVLLVVIILAIAVNVIGMITIDVMEVDAAQYASISREMMASGNYLEVHHRGQDYLDKPPLLFWLSALTMSVFGASGFAYRLPSFLFSLLGAYSTGRLGAKLYGKTAGWVAAAVLMTAQGTFLMAHDVRTDTMLSGAVAFAVWQLFLYVEQKRTTHFVLGFLGIAAAMLTKGPIGLMIPVLALGSDALAHKNWKAVFDWRWALGGLLVLALLSPMLWGLYRQYGSEGIRFYFWTQSFGRITGENPWKDQTTPLFFTHTFLWAFMPWMLLATYAIFKRLVLFIRRKLPDGAEMITLGGFVLPFVAMSFSHYKLPHYIFPLLPFAAIVTAQELTLVLADESAKRSRTAWFVAQTTVVVLLWAAIAALGVFAFPLTSLVAILVLAVLGAASVACSLPGRSWPIRLFVPSALTVIAANFLMDAHVYPRLLEYQAGSAVAHFVERAGIPSAQLAFYKEGAHSMEFYTGRIIPSFDPASSREGSPGSWVFTNEAGRSELSSMGLRIAEAYEFKDFHITRLSLRFLNPRTRDQALSRRYLLHVVPGPAQTGE
jgi:4-amino-4-deoxy-L-arabinose transferase-like glycosyltransferase